MKKILIIFGLFHPFLLLPIVGRDNIYGMLISIILSLSLLSVVLFLIAIDKKTYEWVHSRSKPKEQNAKGIKLANMILRVILICFSIIVFLFMLVPIYFDTYRMVVNNEIMEGDYMIVENNAPAGIVPFFMQNVNISGSVSKNYY